MKEKTKRYLTTSIFIVSAVVFLSVLIAVVCEKTNNLDRFIYDLFYFDDGITFFMKGITFMGSGLALLLIALLIVLISKDKIFALSIPLNLGMISLLNYSLKNLICRPRPAGFRLIEETGYSFPSGHSASSFAFYFFLIYLIFRYCKNTKLKISLSVLLSLLVLGIGVSRVYLGVHYISDVIGGFSLASMYLIFYINFIEAFLRSKVRKID